MQISEEALTLNPGVPHPGAFPVVMSCKPTPFNAYNIGFRKPSEDLPAAILASFNKATKAANDGVESEVPLRGTWDPCQVDRKSTPCVETSGYAC